MQVVIVFLLGVVISRGVGAGPLAMHMYVGTHLDVLRWRMQEAELGKR